MADAYTRVMNVLIFGASGMVGQGVVRECLADPRVTSVHAVVRSPTGIAHPKWHEAQLADCTALGGLLPTLAHLDACFFCLGVSSFRMSEADYTRVTYDLTLAVATQLVQAQPDLTFVYVSGVGTDSTEQGRSMWARVKGRTENALLRLPFRRVALFRPGAIQPLGGIRSKTAVYHAIYVATGWLLTLLRRLFPDTIVTTRQVGRAMIAAAERGVERPIVTPADIRRLSA